MTGFKEEVTNEVLGRSSKRWGLLLGALLVGASVAFWLTRWTGPAAVDTAPASAEPPADDAEDAAPRTTRSTAAANLTAAWTKISQPPDVVGTSPIARLRRRHAAPELTD